MTESIIRIGVIGCAKIAKRSVLPAILDLPNHFKLIAVASRDELKANQFAEAFGCEPIKGYEAIIARDDIDALYIPLPTGLHFEWVGRAIDAGKHVYVEKSFSMSSNQTSSLIELASRKDVAVMEGYMFLYHRQQPLALSFLSEGHIGELRHFHGCFSFPPLPSDDFRYKEDLGGGVLMDAAGYPLRAVRFFCGESMIVNAGTVYQDPDNLVPVWGSAFLSNKEGMGASIAFGFDNFYQCHYEILGSKGKLRVDRAYTPGPSFSPKITIETSDNVQIVEVEPDNHFIGAMLEFWSLIRNKVNREKHYQDILAQSRALDDIKNHALLGTEAKQN